MARDIRMNLIAIVERDHKDKWCPGPDLYRHALSSDEFKTACQDYNLTAADVNKLVANLKRNDMAVQGEHGDIDLAKVRQILT